MSNAAQVERERIIALLEEARYSDDYDSPVVCCCGDFNSETDVPDLTKIIAAIRETAPVRNRTPVGGSRLRAKVRTAAAAYKAWVAREGSPPNMGELARSCAFRPCFVSARWLAIVREAEKSEPT